MKRTMPKKRTWERTFSHKRRALYGRLVNQNNKEKEAEAIRKIMEIIG